ncbi:N-ethylammeline chlorohydrolase [Hahella sp. CCB-MM4]|uniref:TRZ/ATZ family hydrolase n=1 Tax=Hahella sp. (strain CCB-MM4) TaxID=1926491 RepID=UPI000B9AB6BC|nr:TRZ/ATZ family hydrolase [Hahella sp. CCB-MM4]OZG71039.1 N-ethylammeline chlorohydrolase [Hahella sp. CCB-MM4]
MSQNVDLIITARWIVPIRPANLILENSSVVINGGRILDIGDTDDLMQRYSGKEHVSLPEHVLMPGMINAHGHAAMTLFRGMADDLPLMEWLNNHIWPAEAKYVDEDFVRDGVSLAIVEMIRSGTTTFSDQYFFPASAAAAAVDAGMRCQLVFPILDFPSSWASHAEDYIHKGVKLFDEYKHSDLVQIGFGPHAPYTVSDEPLKQVVTLANQLEAPIQIHLHETAFEVNDALEKTGKRPTERMYELGILGPNTQCVHMTQINDRDIELLQETGAHIVHCPESNLKLASGFCPIAKLTAAGINVALGTDGAASNNDLDLLGEMQTAAQTAKAVAEDAAAISAFTALEMATINGAKALGKESDIGSLEAGKWADMIAIDMSALELQPIYHITSHLAYAVKSQHVTHSWIAGKARMADRQMVGIDTARIAKLVAEWQRKLVSTS